MSEEKGCMTPSTFPIVTMSQLHFVGRFAGWEDVDYHSHVCAELVLVTQGRCSTEIDGKVLDGTEGTLFILPAQVAQYQKTHTFTRTTYLGFHTPLPFFSAEVGRTVPLGNHPCCRRWIEDICDLPTTVHPPFSETARLLLLAVLSYVDRLEHHQRLISALHPALARALQFLEEHVTESFTLQHLAEQAYVSTSHLRALFRQHLNCSPSSYQLQLRMRLAEKLLQDPYLTVSEVAQRCGYTDSNYFVRLFRQQHQLPPGHWRVRATLQEKS